jgi:hypothetical protein
MCDVSGMTALAHYYYYAFLQTFSSWPQWRISTQINYANQLSNTFRILVLEEASRFPSLYCYSDKVNYVFEGAKFPKGGPNFLGHRPICCTYKERWYIELRRTPYLYLGTVPKRNWNTNEIDKFFTTIKYSDAPTVYPSHTHMVLTVISWLEIQRIINIQQYAW